MPTGFGKNTQHPLLTYKNTSQQQIQADFTKQLVDLGILSRARNVNRLSGIELLKLKFPMKIFDFVFFEIFSYSISNGFTDIIISEFSITDSDDFKIFTPTFS